MDEYQWVRARVYAAAGLGVTELSDRNVQDMLKQGAVATRPLGGSASDPRWRQKQ
jgi:hypothetical protein